MADAILTQPEIKIKNLYARKRKNGIIYYYFCTPSENRSKRKEIPLGKDFNAALKKLEKVKNDYFSENKLCHLEGYEKTLYRNLKKNSKSRKIDVFLTLQDIKDMLEKSNGVCCLTGIRFDLSKGDYVMRPWIPSIDRINSKLPYTVENCRLICSAVNLAINQYGEDVFYLIALKFKNKHYT